MPESAARLTRDYKYGGFKVPDFYTYYLCAQVQYAKYWFDTHAFIPHVAVEHWDADPIPLNSLLTHDKRTTPRGTINTINSTIHAWQAIARLAGKTPLYSPLLPLAYFQNISVTHERGALTTFEQVGLTTMQDLFVNASFLEADDLEYITHKTLLFLFYFYRLKKACYLHYPTLPAEPPALNALQALINAPTRRKLITTLYCAVQAECPPVSDTSLDRWNAILDPPAHSA